MTKTQHFDEPSLKHSLLLIVSKFVNKGNETLWLSVSQNRNHPGHMCKENGARASYEIESESKSYIEVYS